MRASVSGLLALFGYARLLNVDLGVLIDDELYLSERTMGFSEAEVVELRNEAGSQHYLVVYNSSSKWSFRSKLSFSEQFKT